MASIQFFSPAPVAQRNGKIESDAASTRYRVIIPATQLARRGHRIGIGVIPLDAPAGVDPAAVKADVVVFSKSVSVANEALARALRARGVRVVLDMCDDYFDHPKLGSRFREHTITMCRLADRVVTSTPHLAATIESRSGVSPVVISDPVEGPRGEPCFAPRFPRVKLLWFANLSNWHTLEAILPALAELGRDIPLDLTIITKPGPAVREAVDTGNAAFGNHLHMTLVPWTTDAVWPALAACDIVLIPSGETDFHAAKSPNRLAESLWAGRHVVAAPLPSYLPFGDYATLGNDIVAGIRQTLAAPASVPDRIAAGQAYVARHHSPYSIGLAWEAALGLADASQPLRLNLGCGDKILPGYVNVDVVESRKGQKPDVLCDLHRLTPFSDDSADEILAVHVIEHFWRWEVLDILREWIRVLKPGGRMILECPNLESACRHFLEDPALHAREDKSGQQSMWVFYGDPAWKDPYMIHRWGYTPESLAELMRAAGLVDVRQEPAQYKMREPRDMRVCGTKPTTTRNECSP